MFRPPEGSGWVEVVVGCMFSGKSEELIRRLHRAQIARQNVLAFKPSIDARYTTMAVASHAGGRLPAVGIRSADEIRGYCQDMHVVGIDEAQFLDEGLAEVVYDLTNQGKRVVVAGLDLDYRGLPFGPIPGLMAAAEVVDKLYAVCVVCGSAATRSQRISASEDRVLVGAAGVYEARCRKHWSPQPVFSESHGAED